MTNTLNKIMHNGTEYDFPEGFTPGNTGTTGQVLTKTNDGYEYANAPVTSVNGNTGAVTLSIPTVPTNVSSFNNDAGYLTSSTGVTSVNGSNGAVTVSEFTPGGTATTGYVVTKTANGYEWVEPTGNTYNAGDGIEIGDETTSDMQGPSPEGFHVPLYTDWTTICGILTSTFSLASNATTMGTYLKMPMSGNRAGSNADILGWGTKGRYWSSSNVGTDYAQFLYFDSSSIETANYIGRYYGYAIRCLKNTPTIPTASWTTLYDGSSVASGAGVFWDATNGLISISGDGTTWYTIMDKNLGATTVYNQGDTQSEANCGSLFQWGNNYAFPGAGSSETITTSATQVDVTGYGPGNYYSSSTWITTNPRQDSTSDGNNLWGGVSKGGTTIENVITNTGVLSVNGQTGDVTISGGDVVVSSDADNVLTVGAGLWAGDEADLPATPDSNTLYFCY